jgi:formylglycine-generating enzyme required for sulfatase activity
MLPTPTTSGDSAVRRITLGFGLLLAWTTVSLALGQGARGEKYAFLVVCSKYNSTQLRDLPYTIEEMEDFRKALANSGVPQDHIVMLHDKAERERVPEKAKIEKQFQLLLNGLQGDDTVIVALNGHGVHFRGDKVGYFCPLETDLGNKKTLVPMEFFYDRLKKSKARQKLMIVQSCQNDPFVNESFAAERFEFAAKNDEVPEGIAAIFSCMEGQKSYYDPDKKRGLFFNHVIRAWNGEYLTESAKSLTLEDFFRQVRGKTKADALRFRGGVEQVPEVMREYKGEWVIAAPKSKALITNSLGMRLVYIPPGTFRMGSAPEEIERRKKEYPRFASFFDRESPAHNVEISKGFYLGIHEVTIGNFKQFVSEEGYRTEAEKDGEGGWGYNAGQSNLEGLRPQYNWRNTGWAMTDEHPVVNVTRNDVKAFCAWLSRREKAAYTLPSEAQWEYACRAGTTTAFYVGDDPEELVTVANVGDASTKEKLPWIDTIKARDGYAFTAPVGRFRPNAFGLYDMLGNAFEWCEDCYDPSFYGLSPKLDPINIIGGLTHMARGGGWSSTGSFARSACRHKMPPSFRNNDLGFRVARKIDS